MFFCIHFVSVHIVFPETGAFLGMAVLTKTKVLTVFSKVLTEFSKVRIVFSVSTFVFLQAEKLLWRIKKWLTG